MGVVEAVMVQSARQLHVLEHRSRLELVVPRAQEVNVKAMESQVYSLKSFSLLLDLGERNEQRWRLWTMDTII